MKSEVRAVVLAGVVSVLFANGALLYVEQWGFFEGVQQVLSLQARELARVYVLQEWKNVLSIFQLMQVFPLNPDARVNNFPPASWLQTSS
jgi:hypothetical protein